MSVANYSKTRLGNDQIEGALSLTPRGKRIVYLIVAVLVLAGAAVGIWSAVTSDPVQTSGNGCISVTIPGSTGGEIYHACGAQAKTTCRSAFTHADAVSLAEQKQCDIAGLTKAALGGLQLHDDRHGAVVDEGDLHVGAELTGLDTGA